MAAKTMDDGPKTRGLLMKKFFVIFAVVGSILFIGCNASQTSGYTGVTDPMELSAGKWIHEHDVEKLYLENTDQWRLKATSVSAADHTDLPMLIDQVNGGAGDVSISWVGNQSGRSWYVDTGSLHLDIDDTTTLSFDVKYDSADRIRLNIDGTWVCYYSR